jgi:hypothetical protein
MNLMSIAKSGLFFSSLISAGLYGQSAYQSFGAEMPEDRIALTLSEAVASLGAEDGSSGSVKIEGKITEVCQAKGCWMVVVDGDTYARVTFKDYGFFVPIETSMQDGTIFGELSKTVLTQEQVKHYAEDAGRVHAQVSAEPLEEYWLVASSVSIKSK